MQSLFAMAGASAEVVAKTERDCQGGVVELHHLFSLSIRCQWMDACKCLLTACLQGSDSVQGAVRS